jgi:hypothetical protein
MSNSRHYPDPYRSDSLGRLAGGRLWLKVIIVGICLLALGRMLVGMRHIFDGSSDNAKISSYKNLGVHDVPLKSASVDSLNEFNKRHYTAAVSETSK